MTLRVLVTRSEPGATTTAKRLSELGYVPIVEPLFAIEPLDADIPEFDALAFTSLNGVREMARRTQRRNIPVYCVGDRTADLARQLGFIKAMSGEGDVVALARLTRAKSDPGARILHTGNLESIGDLTGHLRKAGFHAEFVATYQPVPIRSPGPALAAQLAGNKHFDAALIHSAKAATILANFMIGLKNPAAFHVVGISSQSVLKLSGLCRHILVADSPNENAMLDVLKAL